MEEGEVPESVLSGRFSSDSSDTEWSTDESASVIADRIRQQKRETRIPRMVNNNNPGTGWNKTDLIRLIRDEMCKCNCAKWKRASVSAVCKRFYIFPRDAMLILVARPKYAKRYYFRIRPQKGKLAHRKNRELLNIYIYKNINYCKKR